MKYTTQGLFCFLFLTGCNAALGMKETNNKNRKRLTKELEESVVVTHVPTARGFGILRSMWDVVIPEEDNLLADLKRKTFDIHNSSYHRKLSTAIEAFVNKKNDEKLTEMLAICRDQYRHTIKIEDVPALMAHIFLVQQNQNKQQALKIKIEAADKKAISTTNASLSNLKKIILEQILAMDKDLETHNAAQSEEIKKEGAEIRRLKQGLGNIHKLNKTFILPENSYCSDQESNDPEQIDDFYNNMHILQKIKIDQKLSDTEEKIRSILRLLGNLNEELQAIKELHY